MAKANISFEEKLQKFQNIINDLDNNSIPLEDQVKMYEQGMALASELKEYLNNAELKINDITKKYSKEDNV